ncbi:hypothetical protein [Micromonospora kangleipakensis]|nr:hypothetical protein [Micromonospora kangleipakensis]
MSCGRLPSAVDLDAVLLLSRSGVPEVLQDTQNGRPGVRLKDLSGNPR